jgi:hypothetical protein
MTTYLSWCTLCRCTTAAQLTSSTPSHNSSVLHIQHDIATQIQHNITKNSIALPILHSIAQKQCTSNPAQHCTTAASLKIQYIITQQQRNSKLKSALA